MTLIFGGILLIALGVTLAALTIARTNQKRRDDLPPQDDWLAQIPQADEPRVFGPAEAVEALQRGSKAIRWDPKTKRVVEEDPEG